ncbi:hypothetical protein GDO81_010830 [Engystomops pustulosus]|uniref:Cadherin domain-containing protein n=1 Tax=Engystomops pustulosus TaxID=76066 RepID=A0AAV7C3Y3_ENGPU|nr:hypothetical protein GDO81_010830 [Engystomops pustulosus]
MAVIFPFLFSWLCHSVSGHIHYSINEELGKDLLIRKGSIVGNIAKDLQLDVKDLSRRKLRIVSDASYKYFSINLDDGNLYIADRIDRETLCRAAADCVLTFDVVVENPLNVYSIKIDIQDINDNPPKFIHDTLTLDISESSSPGRRFLLRKAEDVDVGVNSLISYRLNTNQYFTLGEKVTLMAVYFQSYTRETSRPRDTRQAELILTASDCGNPWWQWTLTLDTCLLFYFLQSSEPSLFTIDQHTGEIRHLVYQEKDIMKHGIVILVRDNGIHPLSFSHYNMVITGHLSQVLPELSNQSIKKSLSPSTILLGNSLGIDFLPLHLDCDDSFLSPSTDLYSWIQMK